MLPEKVRQELIAKKDETEFRISLKELFIKKGFKHVEITHGPFEKGKDIVCCDYSERLGEIWCGAVVKAGGIGGGTSHSNDLDVIIASTLTALRQDFSHPVDVKKSCRIEKLFIITNGNFTIGAQDRIRNEIKHNSTFSNIEFWGLKKVCEEIQQHCPALVECEFPFLLRYIERVDQSISQPSELLVFGKIGEVDLNQIFVDPVLKKADEIAIDTLDDVAQQISRIQRVEFGSIYTLLKKSNAKLLVLGDPGCGKTTMVRAYVKNILNEFGRELSSVRNTEDIDNIPKKISIPIPFLARSISDYDMSIEELLAGRLEDLLETEGKKLTDIILQGKIRSSLIIDGIDEIPEDEDRKKILNKCIDFCERYPYISLLLTSRKTEFFRLPRQSIPGNFDIYEVMPFSWAQIKAMIKNLAVILKFDRRRMLRLLEKEFGNLVKRLPSTPLAYTLLVAIVNQAEYKEIPATLTILYSRFLGILLGEWDIAKGMRGIFEYKIKENLLSAIAYELHEQRQYELPIQSFYKVASEYFDDRGLDKGGQLENIHQMLREFTERGGILVKEGDNLRFRHLTFQEFLTAKYMDRKRISEKELAARTLDSWWNNVLFFYCGLREEIDHNFIAIISGLPITSIEEHLTRIQSYGHFLQAAFHSPLTAKQEGIELGMKELHQFYNMLIEAAQSDSEVKLAGISAYHLTLYTIFLALDGYSSIVLRKPLEMLYKRLTSKFSRNNLYLQFYIAATLSELGEHNYLLEIFDKTDDLLIRGIIYGRIKNLYAKLPELHKAFRKLKKKVQRDGTAVLNSLKKPAARMRKPSSD